MAALRRGARLAAAKKAGKKKESKFQIPPKGSRCVKFSEKRGKEEDFHKNSFRWVRTPDKGKGAAFIMVGCPKKTRTKTMPRKAALATTWDPGRPLGKQCVFKKDGTKAGLAHHKVVQAAKRGSCRAGYSKK